MTGRVQYRVAAMLVTALAMVVGGLLVASPVSAHAKLVSSSPVNGSSMDVGPAQVVLTFDEPVTVTAVRAQNDVGEFVAVGEPVVAGAVVTVSWPGGQAPGLYRVGYAIASDDGHDVEGTIIFSYETVTPGEATSTTTPAPSRWPLVAIAAVVGAVIAIGAVYIRRRSSGASDVDDDANPAGDPEPTTPV